MLDETFMDGEIAVCIKDTGQRVLMQNDHCRAICGDRLGQRCETGCMALYAADGAHQWKDWGSRVYRNSFIRGGFFDITLLESARNIVTFLQPLKGRYEAALEWYRDKGLTRRETQVVELTIRGASNNDICNRLSISMATLKTHLNNVYRKLRERGETPAFLPACRLPD
jgi:ATP/maltotriose-dependent transcriptional regulator MalT